jgi:hypothetical protein
MWTNKQVWEYEQVHQDIRFDMFFTKHRSDEQFWKSKIVYPNSEVRDTLIHKFKYVLDDYELWITQSNNGQQKLDDSLIPYLLAVIVDLMIDDEICLKFKHNDNYLIVSIDSQADVIDCREFFEAFYHLSTGFNYNVDIGIPHDDTEAEIYLTRLQEEFDEKMTKKLGDKYLPGNNDPDSINMT